MFIMCRGTTTVTAKNEKEAQRFETLGFTRDGTKELTKEEERQLRFSLMGKEKIDLISTVIQNGGKITGRHTKSEYVTEMLKNGWY